MHNASLTPLPLHPSPATPADVAIISDNTTSPVLQFQQQALLPGARKGRNFQVTYTATVAATGLNATCTMYLCSIAGGARADPPECRAFASSGVSRDATVCPGP